MEDLFFFDADCRIGSGPNTGIGPGVRELLDEMDEYGIDRAVVHHVNAPMLGALESTTDSVMVQINMPWLPRSE